VQHGETGERGHIPSALIATLTYSIARTGAALKLKDFRPAGAKWQIHLHEKGGKEQDALPLCVIGNAARLCRCCRHRRRSQVPTVPHQSRTQRDGVDRTAGELISGVVHGPQAHCVPASPRRSAITPPGDRRYEFPGERWRAPIREGHGRARQPAHNQGPRSTEREDHAGLGRRTGLRCAFLCS
jgi:hypothetical protein